MLQVQVRNGLSSPMPNEHLDYNIKVIWNYLLNVKIFQCIWIGTFRCLFRYIILFMNNDRYGFFIIVCARKFNSWNEV